MAQLSIPVLSAADLPDGRVRLTVAYDITFTPAEHLARLVLEETIGVYTDLGALPKDPWLGVFVDPDLQWQILNLRFPLDAVAADQPTVTRQRSIDVARQALNVIVNGEAQDALVATVEVRPYAPPKPVTIQSATLYGEWGS